MCKIDIKKVILKYRYIFLNKKIYLILIERAIGIAMFYNNIDTLFYVAKKVKIMSDMMTGRDRMSLHLEYAVLMS